jgi:3-deoxy-D-manno-octulosonic-acid transferase
MLYRFNPGEVGPYSLKIMAENQDSFTNAPNRATDPLPMPGKGVRWIYEMLFSLFTLISAPFYLRKMKRRGNWKEGFSERFGEYSSKLKQALTNRDILWFHAVSVGEVNLCSHLVDFIHREAPNLKIVISTTTSTGMQLLRERFPVGIEKIYYPIDKRRYVRSAFSTLRPRALILVEAEIWPNLVWQARRQRTPIFLVNARLSNGSYKNYKRFGFLFKSIFSSFAGIGTQTEADREKIIKLGARPETVEVFGSLKFDAANLDSGIYLNAADLIQRSGAPQDAIILMGGSTHDGEEEILTKAYLSLKNDFPNLFLVLIPRHYERSAKIAGELEKLGARYAYRSHLAGEVAYEPGEKDVLLVNSTGELKRFYEQADLVFVGKSLTAQGGQNPIEPGALGKPVIFGPNMQNFPKIAPQFVEANAARQVKNEEELTECVRYLLEHPDECAQMGLNAKKVVSNNLGAIEKTGRMILANMKR